jgi:CheY-like chemotaxis protein
MEKPLLLVVDDEPASRYGIKKALSPFRFMIQEAGTGKEALDKIEHLNPDLVILDVNLPEMDGLSVLSEMKNHHSMFGKNRSRSNEARGVRLRFKAIRY